MNSIKSLDLIPIGKINRPHGNKGELKFSIYNDESKTLDKDVLVWFEVESIFKKYKLEFIRGAENNLIIKLDNIDSVEEASFLKNKKLYISRNDFPKLKNENYYVHDLIGMKIFDNEKKNLGIVIDILNFPPNDVLLVEYNSKEIMIPNVDDFIELFDFENKIIIVKNIKTLFEL